MSSEDDDNCGRGGDDDEFLLYDAGVIDRLCDRAFFHDAISQFYIRLAEKFGCNVDLSMRRLGEAHDYWQGDVERTLAMGTDHETTELDHFKHAAFIAFWLRRLVLINNIWFRPEDRHSAAAGDTAPSPMQIQFYRFGNEICALFAGFYICLAYETYAMSKRREREGNMQVISDGVFVREMPSHLMSEYPKLLKHKNISPHALYMLYRSLFDNLQWTTESRAASAA